MKRKVIEHAIESTINANMKLVKAGVKLFDMFQFFYDGSYCFVKSNGLYVYADAYTIASNFCEKIGLQLVT